MAAERVDARPDYERAAVRAAQIMGLRVAGVDMLEGDDGPLVMEVNSSPGLEGHRGATDLDVAGAIIDYIADQVAFPELDIRQRLTVSTGYGVAELLVRPDAELVGKTIDESGLRNATSRSSRCTAARRDPESSRVPAPGGQRSPAVLRQARSDAVDDSGSAATAGPRSQAAGTPAPRRYELIAWGTVRR